MEQVTLGHSPRVRAKLVGGQVGSGGWSDYTGPAFLVAGTWLGGKKQGLGTGEFPSQ